MDMQLTPLPSLESSMTHGFNLRTNAYAQVPWCAVSYSDGTTYAYTEKGDTAPRSVPNGVFVSNQYVASYDNNSTLAYGSSSDKYNSINNSGTVTANDGGVAASDEFASSYSQEEAMTCEYTFGFNSAGNIVYSVARSPATDAEFVTDFAVEPAFTTAINKLPASLQTWAEQADFEAFFGKYGTHYLVSGSFGGLWSLTTTTSSIYHATMTLSQFSNTCQASYNSVSAGGSLSTTTAQTTWDKETTDQNTATFALQTFGGFPDAQSNITAFLKTVPESPIVVGIANFSSGGQALPQPKFAPLSDLITGTDATSRKSAYDQAVQIYVNGRVMIGKPQINSVGSVYLATTDVAVAAMVNLASPQSNANLIQTLLSSADTSIDPQTLRSATGIQHLSSHNVNIYGNSDVIPVSKGNHYKVETYAGHDGTPANLSTTAWPFAFPKTTHLGAWVPLQNGTGTGCSGTAATDGFVVARAEADAVGQGGYIEAWMAAPGVGGVRYAAASVELESNNWEPGVQFSSLLLPVPKGSTFEISLVKTENGIFTASAAPVLTAYWLPLETPAFLVDNAGGNVGVLGQPAPISFNGAHTAVVTAPEDGFLIGFLDGSPVYPTQSRLYLYAWNGQSASARPATVLPGAVAVVEMYGHESRTSLPYNSVALPVSAGQVFQGEITNWQGSGVGSLWFFPLYYPLNPVGGSA